jgi:MerR family redox-sensitive transcriptional activator SoxR
MAGFPISHVARETHLRPSTLRYYEQIGLLSEPPRVGGQRRYDQTALHRLTLVGRARQLGFTLKEIRQLLDGFPAEASAGARWTAIASRKLVEVTGLLDRLQAMQAELQRVQHCSCGTLDECGRRMFNRACREGGGGDVGGPRMRVRR